MNEQITEKLSDNDSKLTESDVVKIPTEEFRLLTSKIDEFFKDTKNNNAKRELARISFQTLKAYDIEM